MVKDVKITCGLEIHQQLDGKKLFCNCPVIIHPPEKKCDYKVERKLRAVVGETGEIDVAAASESSKGKKFVYECFDENVCLIDLDEAPPNSLNKDVFHSALQVCKLLSAVVVDEVQVMRKTVVDGSNTTGFQRTALVGIDGFLETSKGKVSIPTIIVEEDSAKIVKKDDSTSIYRLDRLGVPLFEVSTGPDMHDSAHCAEVAEQLGLLLRSTGKCKRGIGTIRQDVNVSIEGGARVELKGAQDLKLIKDLVDLEVSRQKILLEIKDELKQRKVKKQDPLIIDISNLFSSNECKIIDNVLKQAGKVLAVKLEGFSGLLGREVQPNKRLGTEFSGRAKVFAGVGGVFHSDELPAYGISENNVSEIKKQLNCKEGDAFVLCADKEVKARTALLAVIDRANECLLGVPMEVRDAKPDATSVFLRFMPGAARMYPETDVPPIFVSTELLDSVVLPELIEDKVQRFKKIGLSVDLAELIAKSPRADLFDVFVKKFSKIKPAFIAEVLGSIDRFIRREFNIEISPSEEDFDIFFFELEKGKIDKASVYDVFKLNKPVKDIVKDFYLSSGADVENVVKDIVKKNPDASVNALMGLVMKELRGKVSGESVMKILKKLKK